MGHEDLLGEDLFASELDEDLLIGADLPEELDPLEDPLSEDGTLDSDDEKLDEEDEYDAYNSEEWN